MAALVMATAINIGRKGWFANFKWLFLENWQIPWYDGDNCALL